MSYQPEPEKFIVRSLCSGEVKLAKKLKGNVKTAEVLATINRHDDVSDTTETTSKVVADYGGRICEIFVTDGQSVEAGEQLLQIEKCDHPGLYGGLCISCGERPDSSMPLRKGGGMRALTVGGGFTLQLSRSEEQRISDTRSSGLLAQVNNYSY
jgi:hypothetical protein